MGSSSLKQASEVMDSSVVSIPCQCSRWYLVQTLAATNQQIFPVVGSKDDSPDVSKEDSEQAEDKAAEKSKKRSLVIIIIISFVCLYNCDA
jgi:hypothetical protein